MNDTRSPAADLPLAARTSAGVTAAQDTSALASDVEAYYHEIAPFYDAELADRDDLAFWRQLVAERPGCRVLELGAGSGAVTAELATAAGLVVGVDLSADLLLRARRRLWDRPHVHLIRADMRALPLVVGPLGSFDLIVAPNDPLSHLVEAAAREHVLRAVASLLAQGGSFVLDALWLPPADAAAVASPRGRVQERESTLNGEALHVRERWRRDPRHERCCEAYYEYRRPGRQPVVATFQARDWTLDELAERLARAGLSETTRWGSYQRDAWTRSLSQHLIVAATHRV